MNANYIYGLHAVFAALEKNAQIVEKIFILKSSANKRLLQIVQLTKSLAITVNYCSKQDLDELTGNGVHQGVVALVQKKIATMGLEELLDQLKQPAFLLVLDGVQDPYNLGACIRTANAAGVHAVIAPKDNAVGITSIVRKVASGAAEATPFIQVTNLARTLVLLKKRGLWIYGASDKAHKSIYQADLTGPIALVVGAEGKGLRRLTAENCDDLICIPMLGSVSSLNVSVATGICLFEVIRQKGTFN